MGKNKIISAHNKEAKNYDSQAKEYDSYANDVLFGMCFEYVTSNEKLLDLGIGTGLASINFSKIGLKIYGIDASQEMLNACKSKFFTEQLLLRNIFDFPVPFNDSFFNDVICCGVLHFFENISSLFNEIKRLIRKNGIFAFTISPSNLLKSEKDYKDFIESPTGWGVSIYKHSQEYINNLLKNSGFELLKEQRVLFKDADKTEHNMEFSVLITQCL
jgi:predicted TPR repeat methyltransferase